MSTKSMSQQFYDFWSASIFRRINFIWVGLVVALGFSIASYELHQQWQQLKEQHQQQTKDLANSLAVIVRQAMHDKNMADLERFAYAQSHQKNLFVVRFFYRDTQRLAQYPEPQQCKKIPHCQTLLEPQAQDFTPQARWLKAQQQFHVMIPVRFADHWVGWVNVATTTAAIEQQWWQQCRRWYQYGAISAVLLGLAWLGLGIRSQRTLRVLQEGLECMQRQHQDCQTQILHHDDIDTLHQTFNRLHNTLQQREAQRQAQLQHLTYALQGSQDGVWDWQVDEDRVYFSPQWKAMLGWNETEVSDNINEWWQRVHPSDLQCLRAELEAHLQGKTAQFINVHRAWHKRNHYRWFLARGQAAPSGAKQRVVGTYTDVTEQKKMEIAFAALAQMNATSTTAFIQHCAHNLLDAYEAQYVLIAEVMDSQQHYLHPRVFTNREKNLPLPDFIFDHTPFATVLMTQTRIHIKQIMDNYPHAQFLRPYHIDNLVGTPLISPCSGQLLGVVTVLDTRLLPREAWLDHLLDIYANRLAFEIERERNMVALQQEKKQADIANHVKMNFLVTMSHDIRTPINGIKEVNELLKNTHLNEQQQHYVEIISHSAESLLEMVSDIIDFAQLSQNKLVLQPHDFRLQHIVSESIQTQVDAAASKHLILLYFIEPNTPNQYYGDALRIRQVLDNLLNNAVKYTQRGEIILTAHYNQTNQQLRFSVKDTGVGMNDKVQERLHTTLFAQGDDSLLRTYGSNGLGLMVSKQIIDKMHGKLQWRSDVQQGSEFWLDLPLAAISEHDAVVDDCAHCFAGKYLLLRLNHQQQQEFVAAYARHWGMNVLLADNDLDGLQQLQQLHEQQQVCDILLFEQQSNHHETQAFLQSLMELNLPVNNLLLLVQPNQIQLSAHLCQHHSLTLLNQPLSYAYLRQVLQNLLHKQPLLLQQSPPSMLQPRILVVEDSDLNRNVVKDMLKRFGYQADYAINGQEAVDILQTSDYDLVFMDCEMPVMDGYTATQQIRHIEADQLNGRHTPIIALTAHALNEHREACFKAGMDDYLTKPLRMSTLRSTLQHWLNLPLHPPTIATPSDANTPPTPQTVQENTLDVAALQQLRELMGEDLTPLLQQFVEYAEQQWQELHEAWQAQDCEVLRRKAHRFKGESLQIGAQRLGELCRSLEQQARRQDLSNASTLLEHIQAEIKAVQHAVTQQAHTHGS